MSKPSLRETRDPWPIVASHIPDALLYIHAHLDEILDHPDLMERLEAKFRKGEAEHQGAWLRLTDPTVLIAEAAEEILDFILYQAMFVALITPTEESAS